MHSKHFLRPAIVTVLILLVPLVAMLLTDEVDWGFFDFVFMGILLFGAGLTYELMARKVHSVTYRTAVGIAVVAFVLLVWINAAVGIIGDDPLNAMYMGVVAIGFLGSINALLLRS